MPVEKHYSLAHLLKCEVRHVRPDGIIAKFVIPFELTPSIALFRPHYARVTAGGGAENLHVIQHQVTYGYDEVALFHMKVADGLELFAVEPRRTTLKKKKKKPKMSFHDAIANLENGEEDDEEAAPPSGGGAAALHAAVEATCAGGE
eukprot:332984-Pyramimonas_sp.AAC.1